MKQESPQYIQNVFHPELGCSWMGVAGQALNMDGSPIVGLTVKLEGTLAGEVISLLSLTGVARQYGEGGYEFMLANEPIASSGTMSIQLLDQAGLPLSDRVFFDTFEDCNQNLILVNFQQVREP
jgi:hypothetical protein